MSKSNAEAISELKDALAVKYQELDEIRTLISRLETHQTAEKANDARTQRVNILKSDLGKYIDARDWTGAN